MTFEPIRSANATSERASQRVVLAFALLAAGMVTLGVGLARVSIDERIVTTAVGTTVYLAGLFLLTFARQHALGLFSLRLGAWFLAYASIVFGAATVSIVDRQLGSAAIVDKATIPAALVLVAVAYTAWAVGHAVGRSTALRRPAERVVEAFSRRRSNSFRGRVFLIGVFTVGVAADLVSAALLGRYGYLGEATVESVGSSSWYVQPLVIASSLKSAALFGLAMRVFVQRLDTWWSALLPVGIVAAGLSLTTGLKESFVTMALALGVPLLLGGGRKSLMWLAATAAAFVLLVAPIVDGIRQDVTDGRGRLSVEQSLQVAAEGVFSGRYVLEPTSSAVTTTPLERLRLIDNVALVADKTPSSIPYRPLSEVLAAPVTGLVPRLLWPDKPVRLSGYEFYVQYYEGGGASASAITLPGSLYLYGGAGVAVLGMFFVGVALRTIDDALAARTTASGALAFLLAFNVVVKQEMDVSTFLANVPVLALTWVLAMVLVLERKVPASTEVRTVPAGSGAKADSVHT